jgi:cell shape-determining protein MreC
LRLQALDKNGLVTTQGLSKDKNKLRYIFSLMQAGVAAAPKFMVELLKHRVAEYETLQAEIETLKVEMSSSKGDLQ